jgi:hypothetical protein
MIKRHILKAGSTRLRPQLCTSFMALARLLTGLTGSLGTLLLLLLFLLLLLLLLLLLWDYDGNLVCRTQLHPQLLLLLLLLHALLPLLLLLLVLCL